jgi:predicted SnoaL-like aldol condensation-catalyzing enzyme
MLYVVTKVYFQNLKSKKLLIMKCFVYAIFVIVFAMSSTKTFAQLPVKPLAPQRKLLESDNPTLARNKKLVYDMWREFLEAGHMEVAEKYFTETYMQHNPNAATGRKALVEFFSKFTKPVAIADSIKSQVVAIVAEGDLVVISFVSEKTDPNDNNKKYSTTWFDMFRVENGKIAEHWDGSEKMKMN